VASLKKQSLPNSHKCLFAILAMLLCACTPVPDHCGDYDSIAAVDGCPTLPKDSFTDVRNGENYRTVKIGDLIWMAENLNYETENSWCYGGSEFNCVRYGRLYTWNDAMIACPAGWHLPTDEEWENLLSVVGRSEAGTKLKSKEPAWDGTDESGFSAMPGGMRTNGGEFDYAGEHGYWWSAMENGTNPNQARNREMNLGDSFVAVLNSNKTVGFSVRCVWGT